MDEEEGVEYTTPSFPWSWKTAAVCVGDFLTSTLTAAAELTENLSVALAASVNHGIEQRQFREAVSRDIESLNAQEE